MSAQIIKGYIVKRTNYQLNDEIITILNENGQLIPFISLGSRKITSKNGRNLFLGNYCEFEVFMARIENKLSRLKKCHAITQVDWRLANIEPFNLLCECITKTNTTGKINFIFWSKIFNLILRNEYSFKQLNLIIMQKFCILNGIDLEVNKCIVCGSKILKTISFKKHGMVCNIHYNPKIEKSYSLEETKLFHYLFNNEYKKTNTFALNFNFAIKLLKEYIDTNLGIKLDSLIRY